MCLCREQSPGNISPQFTVSVCPRAGQETLSGMQYYCRNEAVVRHLLLTSGEAALFILLFIVWYTVKCLLMQSSSMRTGEASRTRASVRSHLALVLAVYPGWAVSTFPVLAGVWSPPARVKVRQAMETECSPARCNFYLMLQIEYMYLNTQALMVNVFREQGRVESLRCIEWLPEKP